MPNPPQATLTLEDGTVFEGRSFGAAVPAQGEVVFSTGMAGYPQSMSDPSFKGQILVMTYPLAGNYGVPVNPADFRPYMDARGLPVELESEGITISGLVVSEDCARPSHRDSGATLSGWLSASGVPGIAGIDTRALTALLREHGTMKGSIKVDGAAAASKAGANAARSGGMPVAEVSPKALTVYESSEESAPRIVLVDCGAKANILRCLVGRGATVIRVPWDHDLSGIDYDGIFLSNGPGDPKACGKTIAATRRAIMGDKTVFGICLGNQILALAAGADTYKLPYGHRSQNQPCVEAGTGRCYITSQNHGYAVRDDSLPRGWEPWFVNANDGTNEGIRSASGPFSAVQFHPEGCPGPRDTEYLIDRFVDDVKADMKRRGR